MPLQILVRVLPDSAVMAALASHARDLVGARVTYLAGLLSIAPAEGKPGQGAEVVQEIADADADAQRQLRAAAAAATPAPTPAPARGPGEPGELYAPDVGKPPPDGWCVARPWPRRVEDVPEAERNPR